VRPDLASIHKIDECIRIDELMQLPQIYFHTLKNLLIK
jgi:acetylornithine deacetylase/succinyl-diaminopimelate desuccinylase-like protein